MDNLNALLLEKNLTLSTAESCTGGMISAAITAHDGASNVFDRGFITYSNAAKIEMLGVDTKIIKTHGAVSKECAASMALGALKNSNANIAVSVTGIAGSKSDDTNKPVGLVYIGIALSEQKPSVTKYNFTGSRKDVRQQTCDKALHLLFDTALAI